MVEHNYSLPHFSSSFRCILLWAVVVNLFSLWQIAKRDVCLYLFDLYASRHIISTCILSVFVFDSLITTRKRWVTILQYVVYEVELQALLCLVTTNPLFNLLSAGVVHSWSEKPRLLPMITIFDHFTNKILKIQAHLRWIKILVTFTMLSHFYRLKNYPNMYCLPQML